VATNLCLDELRRLKRRRELTILPQTMDSSETDIWEELPSEKPGPDDAAVTDEHAEMVRRAVAQLPEHYRSVVVLRHYEDLKFREIAVVLEVPEGTVKSRMAEALSLLNQSLKKSMSSATRKPGPYNPPPGSSQSKREALVL
jgi:RNA polymerase sigma-70 factor (ECF subfamily)